MCMVDWGEGWKVYREATRTARKPYSCSECGRDIAAGETYQHAVGLGYDWDKWETYRTCAHCVAGPCRWLLATCSGYLFHGVQEDLDEHRNEPDVCDLDLLRFIVGMRRKWLRRDGTLMAVPS